MAQYIELKHANPQYLLFYRMGDFYELFFEDAEIASQGLGIALTKRGKHEGEDIPMCGVPVHAADDYLQRLISLGHKIAICEQLEDPKEAKKRGAKSVVDRGVVRLVTAGTLTEDNQLDPGQNSYLLAIQYHTRSEDAEGHFYALAYVDISTGIFHTNEIKSQNLSEELSAIAPKEVLLQQDLYENADFQTDIKDIKLNISFRQQNSFTQNKSEREFQNYFGLDKQCKIDALDLTSAELQVINALLDYIDETQKGHKPALRLPVSLRTRPYLQIDAASRSNLELSKTLSGNFNGSLLHYIDRTITGNGKRLLALRLAKPLFELERIESRLFAVENLLLNSPLRDSLQKKLKKCGDIERSLSRISLNRGGPRDLHSILLSLNAAYDIEKKLIESNLSLKNDEVAEQLSIFDQIPHDLRILLSKALKDELPLLARDGGFITKGYDEKLDHLRELGTESKKHIAALQGHLIENTQVKALKIKHNNMLGYFVEVAQKFGEEFLKPPLNETFIHRQTLANVMRFSTHELSKLQGDITQASELALKLEMEHFDYLCQITMDNQHVLQNISDAIAVIDVNCGLAELAEKEHFSKPLLSEDCKFKITAGRHPVVEKMLKEEKEKFIANDCDLSPKEKNLFGAIWLVTGPNMGGKSTFLRQNAHIAILAQMGSFVPAKKAEIGIVNRLFCRVGASDDLAKGRSTFMVEMVETAAILNRADKHSLVILDELGRGTATYDGLSIAWASVEHLHQVNKSRTLFATHFHELTTLTESLPRLTPVTMGVKEWRGDIVFLHEVKKGASKRSYGLQVARLAGVPSPVLNRAKTILQKLEENPTGISNVLSQKELPLFAAIDENNNESIENSIPDIIDVEEFEAMKMKVEKYKKFENMIEEINIDHLTPLEALNHLNNLKKTML